MGSKAWYTSKTIWCGILTAVIGAAQAIGVQFGVDIMANQQFDIMLSVLGALGIYGRATANTTITK